MPYAKTTDPFPVRLPDGGAHQGTVFLSAILDHPRIEVGDYSYFSSHQPFEAPEEVAQRLAPYLYPWSPERLVIGKFCQIGHGVEIITASANHRYDGLSSFPFAIFDAPETRMNRPSLPGPGPDTQIGHDVWIGTRAKILPGAQIGDGAIIGAGTVVAGIVSPYTIMAGNPAREVRERLSRRDAAKMQSLAWWHWPIETIRAHESTICGKDLGALEALAASLGFATSGP